MRGGEIDGRYLLLGRLGSGGMAEVYLARDRTLHRDVAVKLLKEHHAGDEGFVERFRREARSAASLSHPNVARIFDGGRCSSDGRYYMVMEYVPGGTLKDRIARGGAVRPEEAVDLACQISNALRVAHEAGLVHRDVKPHNVLLTDAGVPKVADFGIARAAAAAQTTGVVLGTAAYMSPEQAMGEPVGPQSDLYSLGVVLYEMLTGTLPFDAETPIGIAVKHVNDPPPAPRETNPTIPEYLDAVTVRLLAKDPAERFGSAADLVEALRNARLTRPAPPRSPEKPASVPSRGTKRPGRLALRTAAVLLPVVSLLGGGAWALSSLDGGEGSVLAVFSQGGPPEETQARLDPPEGAQAPEPAPAALDEGRKEEPRRPDERAEAPPREAEEESSEDTAVPERTDEPRTVPVVLASQTVSQPEPATEQYEGASPHEEPAQYAAGTQYAAGAQYAQAEQYPEDGETAEGQYAVEGGDSEATSEESEPVVVVRALTGSPTGASEETARGRSAERSPAGARTERNAGQKTPARRDRTSKPMAAAAKPPTPASEGPAAKVTPRKPAGVAPAPVARKVKREVAGAQGGASPVGVAQAPTVNVAAQPGPKVTARPRSPQPKKAKPAPATPATQASGVVTPVKAASGAGGSKSPAGKVVRAPGVGTGSASP